MAAHPETAELLAGARAGDSEAFNHLFSRIYDELRRIAHNRLRRHRPGETLNTTALVHEAYLNLVDQAKLELRDRAHFLALASRAMRSIVVDHARAQKAAKRGGGQPGVPLHEVQVAVYDSAVDLLELDSALQGLSEFDQRLGQVVEYRFFGGLSHEEIAEMTGQSARTVKRDWSRARMWLLREMQREVAS